MGKILILTHVFKEQGLDNDDFEESAWELEIADSRYPPKVYIT